MKSIPAWSGSRYSPTTLRSVSVTSAALAAAGADSAARAAAGSGTVRTTHLTSGSAGGETLLYTRSEADARGRLARGEVAAAILVRPTRLDELTAVAAAGDVMPQKSTYFYPKLLTGMVFYPLEG